MVMLFLFSSALSLSLSPSAFAFSPTLSNNNVNHNVQQKEASSLVVAHMAGDDYDDFYADYDPSKFDSFNTAENNKDDSGGGGGYSGGGGDRRRGGGGGGYNTGRRDNGSGRGGGRDSRSFAYSRDTSRDSSNIDEGAVTQLLKRRGDAKKMRDFDTADAIRDELMRDYKVGVDDRELSWRTGVSESGSGRGRPDGGRGRGDRDGGRGNAGRGGSPHRSGGGGRRPKQNFGVNGHDYKQTKESGPNTSGFSEQEIHNMLAERLVAKLSRDFGTADSIQTDLVARGVFVHDGTKEWRFDGVPYGNFNERDRRGQPGRMDDSRSSRDNNRDVAYIKSSFSIPVEGGVTDELIDGLVQERLNYKASRNFDKADAIREGLRTKFNVLIDDRLNMWSVGGDFGEEHNSRRELAHQFSNRGFVKSTSSLNVKPEDEKYIQEQVDVRTTAKKDRDFDTADSIRESLLQEFDVSIDDKNKLWSIGGSFQETGKTPRGVYTRRGAGNISDEDIENVKNILMERYQLKKDRNFDAADDLRTQLDEMYSVKVDDRSSEWRVETDDYALSGPNNLSEEDTKFVEGRIVERFECKRNREYESADDIRDDLRAKFGVIIDDRTKEWKLDPNELDFVAENNYEEKKEDGAFVRYDSQSDSQDDEDDDSVYEKIVVDETPAEEEIEEDDDDESIEDDKDDSLVEEELLKLTVVALKEKLRDAGLPVSGKKSELVDRLLTKA